MRKNIRATTISKSRNGKKREIAKQFSPHFHTFISIKQSIWHKRNWISFDVWNLWPFLPISTSFILYKPFSSLQGKAFLDNRFWKEPPLTSCKIQMSHLSPYYGLDTPNIATRPLVRGQLLAGSPASNHHHILAPIHSLVVSYNGVKVCQKL